MWILGVGAVYEFPKNVRLVVEVELLQLISAEVSIPSGHGGVEAREYIKFACGQWYCCDVLFAMVSGVDDWMS